MFKTLRLYSRQYCIFMLSWHYLYSFGYCISYLVFILDYRLDEARRTYFGSFLEQGGAGKEALPRRDVSTSRRHHVATSPRRDVTTSRRLLKILHLIIKCEEARESRADGSACGQRHEIGDLQTLTGGFSWIFVLDSIYLLGYFWIR